MIVFTAQAWGKIDSGQSLSRPFRGRNGKIQDRGVLHFDKWTFRGRKKNQNELEFVTECAVHLSGTSGAPVLTK